MNYTPEGEITRERMSALHASRGKSVVEVGKGSAVDHIKFEGHRTPLDDIFGNPEPEDKGLSEVNVPPPGTDREEIKMIDERLGPRPIDDLHH